MSAGKSSPMRTALICNDTRGGIQPYLALAIELKNRGDHVKVIAPEGYTRLAEEVLQPHGISFCGLPGDVEAVLRKPEVAQQMEKGFWATHRLMIQHATSAMCDSMRTGLAAAEHSDRLIGGFGGMLVGESIAEKLKIPFIQAHLQPLTMTGEYPGLLAPTWLPRSMRLLNRWTHSASRQIFWQAMRPALNTARKTILDLAPIRFWGNVGRQRSPGELLLYGYSAALVPQPTDWPQGAHVTGYWFLDRRADWQPPVELVRFLEAGPPPVAVGFGSMSSRHAEVMTKLILDAVKSTGQRVIILSGWGGLQVTSLPEWAYALDSCPHDWLFPRCSLAVHHGGAGTTGAALRAGLPSIVIPFGADQYFWAARLQEKQLAISLGSRTTVTSHQLAQAMQLLLNNPDYQLRAQACSEFIDQENGVQHAADLLMNSR